MIGCPRPDLAPPPRTHTHAHRSLRENGKITAEGRTKFIAAVKASNNAVLGEVDFDHSSGGAWCNFPVLVATVPTSRGNAGKLK
jgi:hypothetical protein